VLYDLLGRTIDRDARQLTVERFLDRYRVDRQHATRIAGLASALFGRAAPRAFAEQKQLLHWAALLHEIGMSVSHIGFHKHGAYILQHADMPGFSAGEQARLALLVYGCRGGLTKVRAELGDPMVRAQTAALRLAVLFCHARTDAALPHVALKTRGGVYIQASQRWLAAHPLTAYLLDRERIQWSQGVHPD
jgi:exopolyphosphatase/guanosine-5'-triphosphate,3'-diphosphate pyrophosphatase